MSRENVEIVRELLEAFNRRDVDAIVERWPADAEWIPAISPGGLEGTTYVGPAGLRRWVAELAESWPTFEVIDPKLETIGDRVLIVGRVHARGSASGVELDTPLAQLWELDDGMVRRVSAFASHEEAIAAAGRPGQREN
jgi:ketosteroid isomerase-like protein